MTTLAHTTRTITGRGRSAGTRTRTRSQTAGAALSPRDALRGVALFFGLFSLLNLVGELRTPGFDQNVWWLDLRPLPPALTAALLALGGLLLVWWGLRPAAGRSRRAATAVTAGVLACVAVRNGVTFYHAWHLGQIKPWMPLPLSFVFAAALLAIAWSAARGAPASRGLPTWPQVTAVFLLCGLVFPLAQQVFFGKTAYLRPVQTTVVLGAEVHPDGHASVSLRDRVRTAAQLYQAGLTRRLLMSGARGGREPVNETAVMRALAIGFGVPASAIDVDPRGVNTETSARDTVTMLRAGGTTRVAVVSDFFHLPRVKLAYQRLGLDVTTVPSRAHRIPQTPRLALREIPAFWVYYLRAVLH